MKKKIMLLGSGELGKEFVIACQRKGQYVVACDSYQGAPAMQVADECRVFSMLDGDALMKAVEEVKPDIIVPEIEAIRTERLYDCEKQGIQVVPSAKAVNFTMNRKAIRELAHTELGLKTANYKYASTYEELLEATKTIGFPCIIKPLMSSSGHGQSKVDTPEELPQAWECACGGARGDLREVIVEQFIPFDFEITLLTVTQKNGPTLFCQPIGHVQKGGDYRESFQPMAMTADQLAEAQQMVNEERDKYLRLAAEFDNYRKRTLKEKAELIKNGGEKTLTAILPVLDDFERALKNMEATEATQAMKEGVELIFTKFNKVLAQEGLQKIETEGKDFDVDYHEAIALIPAPSEDLKGKILDCVQTGYTLNDKVIRHAKVAVAQ